jgi:anti-anti-sigma regulatory factor
VNKESIYQVCATNEEVFVRIKEKASYLNCAPLRSFLYEMVKEGNKFFVIDFENCSSMDSTFLGILVGLSLKLKREKEGGSLTLLNLVGRNLETVENLGIHKIAIVSSEFISNLNDLENLHAKAEEEKACPEVIYRAHKSLLDLNQKNSRIFRDVVNYLEQKVEDSA